MQKRQTLPASSKFMDTRATKLAAAHNNEISKLYSLRTIPNCIASRWDRYHSARQLASTRWVPVNTQKVNCCRKRLHGPEGEAQMPNLTINGRNMSVEAANDTPLLWVIREQLQMTGT